MFIDRICFGLLIFSTCTIEKCSSIQAAPNKILFLLFEFNGVIKKFVFDKTKSIQNNGTYTAKTIDKKKARE